VSNQTRLKTLMIKHSMDKFDVAKLIFISPSTVAVALSKPSSPNYKRFTNKNLNHLELALAAKIMEDK